MRIVLSNQSSIPIYEQIKDQIKASILSGEVKENEKLPSMRQLARDLKVSVISTTRAYNDLELEGYIVTVPGKGCYVKKPDRMAITNQCMQEIRAIFTKALKQSKVAGIPVSELHKLLDELDGADNDNE